jgi:hypothetical protein
VTGPQVVTVVTRERMLGLMIWLVTATKLLLFTVIGLTFVALAAFFISVIQFQIRIIEAKNQSKNFSLTSLTQSVAMQDEFVASVRKVQESELEVAEFNDFQTAYYTEMAQFASLLCAVHTKSEDQTRCASGISGALQSGSSNPTYVQKMIAAYTRAEDGTLPDHLQEAADGVIRLADRRTQFTKLHGQKLVAVRMACAIIDQYLATPGEYGGAVMSAGVSSSLEKSSFIQDFSREYVLTARLRCYRNFSFGVASLRSTPAIDLVNSDGSNGNAGQTAGSTHTVGPQLSTGGTKQRAAEKRENFEADLAGALYFDLVSYYRFYENMINSFGFKGVYWTEQIVIAPIDISFVLLVIVCGALGAMLRISGEMYNPGLFGKEPAEQHKVSSVYYFVIGIMCSLIVYILAKTAFAGITETAYVAKSGNLSPFVTAFLAVVSGLICEEAFQQIIFAGRALLARSGGKTGRTRQSKTTTGQ